MSSRAEEEERRYSLLDAYLLRREADGYRVETRSSIQAVIFRRHRLYFALRWVPRAVPETRLVVSVDQDGDVTATPAAPRRW